MVFSLLKGFLTNFTTRERLWPWPQLLFMDFCKMKKPVSLIFLFIVFFSPTTWATITIVGFEEKTFSYGEGRLLNNNGNNVNFHTIYGGYSGACSTFSNDSVCNSCQWSDSVFPCNRRRIHDDLVFSLRFRTTDTGPILITTDSDDNQITLENVLGPAGDIPGNSEVSIGIRWSEICRKIFGGTGCSEDQDLKTATFSIRIGIDSNRDGKFHSSASGEYSTDVRLAALSINHGAENCRNNESEKCGGEISLCYDVSDSVIGACNFSVYPGDGKVYVDNIRGSCDFPSVGESRAQALRVFYSEQFRFDPNEFADLSFSENHLNDCSRGTKAITTIQNKVEGLMNDKKYFFRIGVVDKARNVGFVTEYSDERDCFHGGEEGPCHSTTPMEVVGLTEKESDCFITTATYGSFLHPKVKTFRKFRNRFLKTNSLGRFIIRTYYRYSPLLADWISRHPRSRIFWKILLWPLWLFAKICLDWFFHFLGVFLFFTFLFGTKKKLVKL